MTTITDTRRELIPLPDCARHLARLWPTMPLDKRSHVSKLREQIRAWDNGGNRDGLRKEIPKTIAALAPHNAEERRRTGTP